MKIKVLDSIISLFALIAVFKYEKGFSIITNTVDAYLSSRFSKATRDTYLNYFHKKITSYMSFINEEGECQEVLHAEVAYQCGLITKNTDAKERFSVLVYILEYIPYISENFVRDLSEPLRVLLQTIVDNLEINENDFNDLRSFVLSEYSDVSEQNSSFLICNSQIDIPNIPHKAVDVIDGYIVFIKFSSLDVILFKIYGDEDFKLNDVHLFKRMVYYLEPGGVITTSHKDSFFYNDINKALSSKKISEKLLLEVNDLEYSFPNGNKGVHPVSFSCSSGEIVAIMGGSGAGKTTLMNLLIGEYMPTRGNVKINGVDVYENQHLVRGYVGYVPQDDALNEDLTAFENLYYVAGLSLKHYTKEERRKQVEKILDELRLSSIRDLKVGNPLEKIISGGQRKRLNIAIELIRNPGILFLDEPTSGLSSADSEILINVLRRVADNGRMVILNIHQPSSDIFKRFDQLLFIDQGGYPVYFGPAVSVLSYLKKALRMVDAQESQCGNCGNLNPEEIFHLVNSQQIVYKDDKKLHVRIFEPISWMAYFNANRLSSDKFLVEKYNKLVENKLDIPNRLTQFSIFFTRLFLSKVSSYPTLLLNLVLPSLLAFILSVFSYYISPNNTDYSFYSNENMPAYYFMSVIVALFIGVMSSSSEINRDRRTLKRESFLKLSFGSYLFSRLLYISILNGIQMFSYVLVTVLILKIPSGFFSFFMVMWLLALSASAVGLVLSSLFKSLASIYISIPFILIPQILFSGAVIDFNKINKIFASEKYVPAISEMMPSRWGYEALMVNSYMSSDYAKVLYPYEKDKNQNSYFKNFLIPEIEKEFFATTWTSNHLLTKDSLKYDLVLDGINKIEKHINQDFSSFYGDTIGGLNFMHIMKESKRILLSQNDLFQHLEDSVILSYSELEFDELQSSYNSQILKILVDESNIQKVKKTDDEFVRKMSPIYFEATNKLGRSHHFAPEKQFLNMKFSTVKFNSAIIIVMTIVFLLLVYKIKPKY